MDKRWRNLIVLFAIVIVIALGYLYTQTPVTQPLTAEDEKVLSYFSLMEQADVNYGELKIALEFFEHDLSDEKLDFLEVNGDEYIKTLVGFERRQKKVAVELDAFFDGGYENTCDRDSEKLLNETLGESILIVAELDSFLEKNNPLAIDTKVLFTEEEEINEYVHETILLCIDNYAEVALE